MKKIVLFAVLISIIARTYSQQNQTVINPVLLKNYWSASWITHPTANLKAYGVYHFRKTFDLQVKPESFIVHVSGDNRYRLFVNGTPVCFGPARSDVRHWNFETVNIAPFLKLGKNLLAAVVWNFGDDIPAAQMTFKTAFILQGNTEKENIVNTDKSWKVFQDESYSPLLPQVNNYIVVGPGEIVNGDTYPWNWQDNSFDDTKWLTSGVLCRGRVKGLGTGAEWDLVPRDIPFLEETEQRFNSVRRAVGCKAGAAFLQGKETLTIPANSTAVLLLDQGVETVAYPEITVSASKGSKLELIYSEALYDAQGNKGNRNEIEGKTIKGITDVFKVGSVENQIFRPLWFRTFRYVQLSIKTGDSPLTVKNIQSTYTVYPFKELATFKCNDTELENIWKVGWRTLRLCSNETHYDCPYYEQLQYVGDTRIQCLISAYVSGDDRLMRKAIMSFDNSRFSEGLTCSRYPSSDIQVIPPFSLFWTNMIHDYWMWKKDTDFVKPLLSGIENVFNWYEQRIDNQTNMLGQTPYWNFVDWPDEWGWDFIKNSGGVPNGGMEGGSSILTFQLAYALNDAADLFLYFGDNSKAEHYKELAKRISAATVDRCWDKNRDLLANTPDKDEYSQHANIMAIMANANLPVDKKEFIDRISKDTSLIKATVYYRFYLFQAMKKCGLGDKYVDVIKPWRDMIKSGLTTFSERLDPTRSDCHAWSASPTYELLATVCGIEPAEAGFKTVKIEPHLGTLKWVEASMPHENGTIKVQFQQTKKGGLIGDIELPKGVTGTFVFKSYSTDLHEGTNYIRN